MNDILIGISTYNEIENLPTLVKEIDEHLPRADILIVDDNSPDGTGRWSDVQAQARDDFSCIQRAGKLGLGSATIATLQTAIDKGYRFVINMDADLSHSPKYLPALVAAIEHQDDVDVAVGSRYVAGGGVTGWPLTRKIMSRGVNAMARLLLRLPTHDCSGSFRCYRVSTLEQVSLDQVRSQGYSFFEEILWHLRHAGASFVEVPIVFQDRERGKSKINLQEVITAVKIISTLAFSKPAAKQSPTLPE